MTSSSVQTPVPQPTRLWLFRHGEVEAPYQGVFGGRIDMALSPVGREQAVALANYLKLAHLDALYASPMKRVQETLAPVLANGFPKPTIMPGLREVDFGEWTGLTWEEVQVKFGISAFSWLDQLEAGAIAHAENARTFRERVEPCLRQILGAHPGQQVGIACHGGVIRMLLAIVLGWPLSRMGAFELEYASVTQVIWVAHKARLHLVNFTPWRDLSQ